MTKTAATFVRGRSRGRKSWLSIQIGRVSCCPAVKVVTITSSKLRAKASMPPANRAVATFGSTTWRNVWKLLAPRSIEASMSVGELRRSRDHIVVNDDNAKGGVAQHDRPIAEGDSAQREGRAQADAGNDSRKRDRQ